MSPKTTQAKKLKKKSQPKKGKAPVKFARKELFLWLGVVFLVMVWMFILGVIVGRGISPVRFDVEKLKQELVALKEKALKSRGKLNEPEIEADAKHLGFYDILTEKKEKARMKSLAEVRKPSSGQVAKSDRQASSKLKDMDKAFSPKVGQQKPKTPAIKGQSTSGSYTLQVASFRDLARAERLISTLGVKGYRAYHVTAHVNGKGTYHRVRTGHFKDRNTAHKILARLRRDNFEPIVIEE